MKTARCYLVAKPLSGISLRSHLQRHGNFQANEICEALRQVLQTLQFLHTVCRVQFSTTHMERGIPHGNLTLDSLFIRQTDLVGVSRDRQFFIHVADLLLWEHLIYPPSSPKFHEMLANSSQDLGDPSDDLKDLGRVGFQLAGCTIDADTDEIIGLHEGQARQILNNDFLYHFLCRLIGEETPLRSADEALQALRNLSETPSTTSQALSESAEEDKARRARRFTRWGLPIAALALVSMGAISWWMFRKSPGDSPSIISLPISEPDPKPPEELYIREVFVPSGDVQYQVEKGGAWQVAMFRTFQRFHNGITVFLIST